MTDIAIGYQPLSIDEVLSLLRDQPGDHRVVLPVGYLTLSGNCFSYRGYYDQFAIEFKEHEYGSGKDFTVADMIAMLEGAIGTTYEGWKGGDYTMRGSTPVWVVGSPRDTGGGIVGIHSTWETVLILSKFD